MPPRPKHRVPAIIRGVAAQDCEFALVEAAEGDGPKLRRFSMTAYTGGLLAVAGYHRPVVVDLSGQSVPRQNMPALRDHDAAQIVGHTEEITASAQRVKAAGVVSGVGEAAQEVIALGANKFPWQVSCGWKVDAIEFVEAGRSVNVNGRRFDGPIYVARRTTLREVSFVSIGADGNTSATVAASAPDSFIEVSAMPPFAQWVEAQGFKLDDLSDVQKTSLQATYDALKAAQPDDDPPADPPPKAPKKPIHATGENTDDDPIGGMRAAASAESRRIATIGKICAAAKDRLDADKLAEIQATAIDKGWDADRTELQILRDERPKGPAIHAHGGESPQAGVIEASLALSAGVPVAAVKDQYDEKTLNAAMSREHRGMSITELCHIIARAAGKYIRAGRLTNESVRDVFHAERQLQAAGFSTVSLSGILGNVANKALMAAYLAVNRASPAISATRSNSDFKAHSRYRMTQTGAMTKVGPDGELKHVGVSEETFSSQVDTWGGLVALTRKMIVNDDLGAFLQLPRMFGRNAALAIEKEVFTLLLSNPASFFHADNKNLITGASTALSIASLTQLATGFLDQVDANGDPVLVSPAVLLVPSGLSVYAQQLFNDTSVNETTTTDKAKPASNPHRGLYRPVTSPYLYGKGLTGQSATAFYLFADPADIAAIVVAYLNGNQTPTIESGEMDFSQLGVQWRCYFDFGVGMEDHRGAAKSAGA